MTEYRPLSKQGVPDPDLDSLHEEVEPWMSGPLITWLRPHLWFQPFAGANLRSRMPFIERLEMAHRIRTPFDRTNVNSPAQDVERRINQEGGTFGLDVVGFALSPLGRVPGTGSAHEAKLDKLLKTAGSAWEVTAVETDGVVWHHLTRRDLAAAKGAITEIASASDKAGRHLKSAWEQVATREPDPDGAYDQAVKAVEAAAQPVVSPANTKATLGTIIADLKAKPGKWTFALGDLTVVIDMAEALWKNHIRHGTDVRTDHTLPEADAALHLAIPLTRFFAGRLVRVTET